MADQQEILDLIERAAKEGSTGLNLSFGELTSLPPEIGKLISLTNLDLSYNYLKALPPEINKLTNLTLLKLTSNQLTSLPPEVTRLTKLTYLNLSFNQLTSLPPEIAELTSLVEFDLFGNRLTSLPPEIGKLTNLEYIDLGDNELTGLPQEIGNLTNLRTLHLHSNQLASVPLEITKLVNLTDLAISENQLTSVPLGITSLTNLKAFYLNSNKLPIPPETLDNQDDVKAIFAAIAGMYGGERLNEAKMLVVGDGKVGKSSVVERLLGRRFNPQRETTLGVEISDEMRVVQSEVKGEGEPVRLNIWDFGGQEIQHSTHQFFLTTRSLYLLVVDARKGDQISNIEYWLKLIESFGGDSPIIIVINQIDQLKGQRALNLDRRALQAKYNIRDFVETSCLTGEGIAGLKKMITREVEALKHVRDIWPREWLAVKRRLKDMRDDYIPIEKYLEICDDEKLNDADIRKSLLEMLHVLGTVIRFPGDMQVLNPRWVTQGVYGLLTSKQLVRAQGQFDLAEVSDILSGLPDAGKRYPPHTHRRLIEVMKHFELCFEFPDHADRYLIPRHLHDNEPDVQWDETDALKFQYHYVETLPDAVISRFIVRMNRHILRQGYWKNGVFLDNKENQAKVRADLVDRKIFISVTGKQQTRRAFLAVIRAALDEINSNYKIEIEQKIPVPGSADVLVSYQDLLVHEEMGEPEMLITTLRKKFPVRELLDGVEELSARMERRERDARERRSSRVVAGELQPKQQRRVLRIVVASPGDVQPERDVLPSVVDEVNRIVAADRGLHLELSRWETDTHPGFHALGPQGLIDPVLKVTDCDLLIGIFWKRFGTPTSDGKTGTEHEFNLAYQAWQEKGSPQIFIYFNQKPYTPESKADTEQWGRVLEFKEKFPKEGLWWPYKGKTQFKELARTHLINYIRNLTYQD